MCTNMINQAAINHHLGNMRASTTTQSSPATKSPIPSNLEVRVIYPTEYNAGRNPPLSQQRPTKDDIERDELIARLWKNHVLPHIIQKINNYYYEYVAGSGDARGVGGRGGRGRGIGLGWYAIEYLPRQGLVPSIIFTTRKRSYLNDHDSQFLREIHTSQLIVYTDRVVDDEHVSSTSTTTLGWEFDALTAEIQNLAGGFLEGLVKGRVYSIERTGERRRSNLVLRTSNDHRSDRAWQYQDQDSVMAG